MKRIYRIRQVVALLVVLLALAVPISQLALPVAEEVAAPAKSDTDIGNETVEGLAKIPVKGRAPKTGYARSQFGSGWATMNGCDTRNIILARDLVDETVDDRCRVLTGTLHDPYTGTMIEFTRGPDTSDKVQIDHVVALSNAWQTGAQQLTPEQREALANDPLNLLAVDGAANQEKSDGDAATWLPPQKTFRCQYVERQVKVKQKYSLWVTEAEKAAIMRIANSC